jgi:hypothetical protein
LVLKGNLCKETQCPNSFHILDSCTSSKISTPPYSSHTSSSFLSTGEPKPL